MSDQITDNKSIETNNHIVSDLANYAKTQILDETKKPKGVKMTMFLSEWYPSYRWNPEETLKFIYDSFSEVAERFKNETSRKPVMVELGAGEGMVAFTASATNKYEHCWGIEYRENIVDWGQENQRELEAKGLIPKGNTNLVAGSYYTSNTWESIGEEVLGKDYKDPRNNIHGLEKADLIDTDGKLKADVVYWYPSDPYLELGADQWKNIFRSGTYLILGPSGQIDKLESTGVLDEFELIERRVRPAQSEADVHTFRNLYIYRKK